MATTYEEIIGFLNEEEIGFADLRESETKAIVVRFTKGEDDDMPETVFIKLDEKGEFVHFYEPQRYKYADGEYKEKVLETLLAIQWESKMLQWEYDPRDGEIRACIELPLEDALLTKRQFLRVLHGLVQMMDGYHERIKRVMETGEDSGPADQRSAAIAQLEAMLAKLKADEEPVPEAV